MTSSTLTCLQAFSVEHVKSWPTAPYPGTAERAGGEAGRCATDRAGPDKENRGQKTTQELLQFHI